VRLILREGRQLAADNGNVDLIRSLIQQMEAQAADLDAARKREEQSLRRYARPGDLSPELTNHFQKFAYDVFDRSGAVIDEAHVRATVRAQEALKPTYLIGMEDFTIVTLTGLNVEPEYSNLPLSWYARSTCRAIEYAVKTCKGHYGPCNSLVFAGLHAIDYDTALQAGTLAGDANVDGIATGLVGVLKDRNYVDFRIQDGQLIQLGENLPRPYLRLLDIAAGLHVGFANTTGKRPRFHALGAGSPILIPLLALLGDAKSFTAVDSTAPIKDAYSSRTISLYVDEPAPRKLKAHRIAEYWLSEGVGWSCTCPYCRRFNTAYPPDILLARDWWQSEGKRRLRSGDMRDDSPLSNWFPLLSSPSDSHIRREAGLARIGHNHWVLRRLEQHARRHATDPQRLRDWVAQIMDAYLASPGSNAAWKASAKAAWQVADATSVQLVGAKPSETP
jgi:hypothetical protein